MSNLTGFELDSIGVGDPVEVEFVAYDDELTLPAFHPAPRPDPKATT